MYLWRLQSWMWDVLPSGREVNITVRLFGLLLIVSLIAFGLGKGFKRRWLTRTAAGLAATVLIAWGLLLATRPAWLLIATRPVVPSPALPEVRWETRSPGLETSEFDVRADNTVVDHMVLVRLDPHRYRFSVHWDPTATRTAEAWQRELGAAVVVSGTYFGTDFTPLTPLKVSGRPAGPGNYQSSHGALVAKDDLVDVIDLKDRDVSQALAAYPEALVSYPLLIDAEGNNRAAESKEWLASRNFAAIDNEGRVVLGTTRTGFFTIRRLGEFLKAAPLGLRKAINFDGGPLVTQVVRAGGFSKTFNGIAEMSVGTDVVRAFWHAYLEPHPLTLPIVLVATPVAERVKRDQ